MRRLQVHVPASARERVEEIFERSEVKDVLSLSAQRGQEAVALFLCEVRNDHLDAVLLALEDVEGADVQFAPRAMLSLRPARESLSSRVTTVTHRSALEIFLAGLQSVGAWTGFVGYSVAAGIVCWVGLLTNTIYLLTAAMLIAPFAGPAMTLAIASARGDRELLGRSLLRYAIGLTIGVAISAFLTWSFRLSLLPSGFLSQSQVSSLAVLLPLVAGAAGALNLVQSDRNSLVSGASVGVLVASALTPPTSILGAALVLARWEVARAALFLLALQLAAINLSASAVFRLFGLHPAESPVERGDRRVFPLSLAVSMIGMALLLTWQFFRAPELQRSSLAQRARDSVTQAIRDETGVKLVDAEVRFPRVEIGGRHALLVVLYVLPNGSGGDSEHLRQSLVRRVREAVHSPEIEPLVSVVVLRDPHPDNS